ncbi:LOW QUALITY PROTEIN: hypothetical protein YC2023_121643 [Brassica napus]
MLKVLSYNENILDQFVYGFEDDWRRRCNNIIEPRIFAHTKNVAWTAIRRRVMGQVLSLVSSHSISAAHVWK